MKAKHIKKLRSLVRYYDVWVTSWCDLFGVSANSEPSTTVLARTPKEAAKRAYRKGIRHKSAFSGLESSPQFGRYAVRPSDKTSERFTTYWK